MLGGLCHPELQLSCWHNEFLTTFEGQTDSMEPDLPRMANFVLSAQSFEVSEFECHSPVTPSRLTPGLIPTA